MISSVVIICITIFGLSLWKVYLGAVISSIVGFNYIEMLLLNLSAVAFSSIVTILIGQKAYEIIFGNKKGVFSKRLRKIVIIWKKYGYWASALLAPVLLGIPTFLIIGTRLKEPMKPLLFSVLLTSTIWLTIFFYLMQIWDISSFLEVEKYLAML